MDPTASEDPGRMLARFMSRLTHDSDDECITSIRCNGRAFHIHMSPSYFRDSPTTEARYRKFLEAVRDECEEDPEEVESVFYEWLIEVFQPIFSRLAPEALPSFDPAKIRAGEAKPLLSEYLFPETFGCKLEAVNDTLVPLHTDDSGGLMPPGAWVDEDLLDDLDTWAKSFDPSAIEVFFEDADHALYRMPTRVLVNLDGSNRKTACFFKEFGCGEGRLMEKELEKYLEMHKSKLAQDTRVIRLEGIVKGGNGSVMGLLLTYVDHSGHGLLAYSLNDDTPLHVKERWARQVRETVGELHEAGIIWGDAKAGNVMIDRNENAWIVDFGGGYTLGWVDEDKAGTVEGDIQGVERIVEYIFNEDWARNGR